MNHGGLASLVVEYGHDGSTARTDLTHSLASLLCDRGLRQRFREDPCLVAIQLAVADRDRATFIAMKPDDVDRQADTLVDKRFHEVARLLPVTFDRLGNEVVDWFRRFTDEFWPSGNRRHLVDAAEFGRFVQRHMPQCACTAEINRVAFEATRRRLALHWVRRATINNRARRAIQLLYRAGHSVREWVFYLM